MGNGQSEVADHLVIGQFEFLDDTLKVIKKLREHGFAEIESFSPFPNHELEDEIYLGKKRSPVRRCTLLGGLTGCLGAFLMTIWMSIDYPVRVSAKPLVSIPSFIVISYECTILLGAICTLIGMFHFSRIPWLFGTPGFRPEFSEGTFGLMVRTPKERAEAASQVMKEGGVDKVEVQYVR